MRARTRKRTLACAVAALLAVPALTLGGQPSLDALPDVAKVARDREKSVVRVETLEYFLPGLLRRGLRLLNPFPLGSTIGDAASFVFYVPSAIFPGLRRHLGSGVVIGPDGYLVTNNHVVRNSDRIVVRLTDAKGLRRKFTAKVVGTDTLTDIALVKIDPEKVPLVTAPLGDSDRLVLGDWIVAIGNPLHLTNTVTAGVVSGLHRHLRANNVEDYIQIAAPVNPGNSGGPILNTRSEIVGIVALGMFPANDIGFAIPSNLVTPAIPDLKRYGQARRGYLGMNIRDVTPELAKEEGLGVEAGAYVTQVAAFAPAGKAGIRRGDVIIAIGGQKVADARGVQMAVLRAEPGKPLSVTVLREGKTVELTAEPAVRRASFRIF